MKVSFTISAAVAGYKKQIVDNAADGGAILKGRERRRR